jgi:DNA-binding CsgD family transcriptional regulator
MSAQASLGLRGRTAERAALDRLLEDVRADHSAVLVVHGEAGVGKTALLRYCIRQAADFRIAHGVGIESEMELPFAGLHQLCGPMLGQLDALPEPQRDALSVAFGRAAGNRPDRFLIALSVLSLFAEVGEERRLLCVVDDAQWLDRASAQILGFVARRLQAESVGLLFAVREPNHEQELADLPALALDGLDERDARALLATVLPGRMDEGVRDRIVTETHGNPLALLEFPHGLSPAGIAGGFALPDRLPVSGQLEESFRRQVGDLSAEAQRLLLLAAAEPVGDSALIGRAAERLGVDPRVADDPEAARLLEYGTRARFRHPLVRSVAYRLASPEDRRAAHAALADATDAGADPDRRAWHLAEAAAGRDEDVAAELECSADRAQARGGAAAAAAFLERASSLTLDPAKRIDRALAAAQAKHDAGAPGAASKLLMIAEEGSPDELQCARLDLLRAQLTFMSSHGGDASQLLLKAARRLEPLDLQMAREAYLDAMSAAMFVGRLAPAGNGVAEVAAAARGAPPASGEPRAFDLLLDGLAVLITDGYEAGTPLVQRALSAFRSDSASTEEGIRWLFLAVRSAHDLWDDVAWHALCVRHVQLARDAGALAVLPVALSQQIGMQLHAGEFAAAASLVAEMEAVEEATGNGLPPYGAMALAGWQGRSTEALRLIDVTTKALVARGEGMGLSLAHHTSAVLNNGLGRYEDAFTAAEQASAYPDELGFSNWGLVELIEAAARTGRLAEGNAALERLVESTGPTSTPWGRGIEARSRAVLSEAGSAEGLYLDAIQQLGDSRGAMALARARLLYGEWLRREGRRIDAREQLGTAQERFASIGARAFSERAHRELLATGAKARKRSVETRDELTDQERQIALLARDGLSNPEIGTRLFLSPRTVEWHLRKVFAKLEISSRKGLRDALPGAGQTAVLA